MESKVIIIVGPTCSGKTDLSINLAQNLSSEIISADSRQIYKCLNIGTAKPNKVQLALVKHHLIDTLNPDEDYNASLFENDSIKIINNLHSIDKIPIVVGGSGLYIKALVDGIFDSTTKDETLREKLLEDKKNYGNEYLYNQLLQIDKTTADKLLPQNWKRIIRAIEVYKITGRPIWELHNEYKRECSYNFYQFGLNWHRDKLYENIEKRVDEMINLGLVKEIENIIKQGYNAQLNALNTVGYKEIISYLKREISLNRAIELIKRNTRRYAKRQLTWFRKDNRIKWFQIQNKNEIQEITTKIINEVQEFVE